MGDETALELPCLGKPFRLGMLYDCRSDSIIPGMTLWRPETLQAAVDSRPQPNSTFEIIGEDSMEHKTSKMGISASLKLSFLAGLVEVSGSAKYLDERKSSTKQARVTLKYESTSKFEQLTMGQLGNIEHVEVCTDTNATHVVTAVLYGVDAFFIFDRLVDESETYRDVHGSVKAMVDGIPGIKISGEGSVELNEEDKKKVERLQCKFHGDILLPNNPSSFEEAVKLYKKLPELIGDVDNPKSVPKKVWLLPLTKLDSQAAKLVKEISVNLVTKAQSLLEELHEMEIQVTDLLKLKACSTFSEIYENLSKFKEHICQYKMTLSRKLARLIPNVRGGKTREEEIAKLFEEVSASPFNKASMSLWIKKKNIEVKILSGYLDNFKDIPFAFSPGELEQEIHSLENERVVCFSFTIPFNEDEQLIQMNNFLQQVTWIKDSKADKGWFENRAVTGNIRRMIKKFKSFAEANSTATGTKFLVTTSRDDTSNEGAVIELCIDGVPTEFDPPGRPGKPSATTKSASSIQLEWASANDGTASIQQYTVDYRCIDDPDEHWSTLHTDGINRSLKVTGLTPKSVYVFKVYAVSEAGNSDISEVSEPIKTESTGGDRLAERMLKQSKKVKAGVPAIHELYTETTMTLEDKMISKKRVGNPSSLEPKHKVLMVLGATGAGKTTLINGMINYVMGVQCEDSFRYKLIFDVGGKSQAKSQTGDITAYTLHKMDGSSIPYTFTVIDTPGFGDTDGLKRDKFITSQIKEFFSLPNPHGIDHLDGIGFVTQASLARLTATQKYIFDSILAIFGNDVKGNIFPMVTFSDAEHPPVMEAIKEAKIPHKTFYAFNNSALFANNSGSFTKMFWKLGEESFKQFFTEFGRASSVSLQLTRDVLKERDQLQSLVEGLQPQIEMGLSKINEMHQEEKVLERHAADIEANQGFTYELKVTKFRKVPLPSGQHTTTCQTCNFTCHKSCAFADDDDKRSCCSMGSDGNCTVCTRHCWWQSHKNVPYVFEYYEAVEQRTYEHLKANYDKAVAGKTRKERMLNSLEAILQKMHQNVLNNIRRMRESLTRLDHIALKPNPLTELEYIELLIDSEKREKNVGWKERLSYYEEAKRQAQMFAKAKNVEEFQKLMDSDSSSKSWWSKLKFW